MSYLALYRKYRPTTFEEVVGQEYVKKILKNSIKSGKISHAYLFSGPRGTGKTTMAKLISKLINCYEPNEFNPCDKCKSCLAYLDKNNPDIIEIDAASNNGVDEIREIREKVNLMPSLSKYKIYIIDEVHMLSIGAFNALLKTLEEPPKHVIFILATTEFYKVPETIVSRCQCFDFEKISVSNIEQKLNEIINKEQLDVDENVVPLIAKYSNGGLRDAINMLDKLISSIDKVTLVDFYEVRGLVTEEKIKTILEYLKDGKIDLLFDEIDELDNKGKSLILLVEEIMNYLKDDMINCIKNNKTLNYKNKFIFDAINVLNDTLNLMKNSSNPKIILEVNLLKIIEKNKETIDNKTQTNVYKKEIVTIEKKEEQQEENQIKEKNTDALVTPINLIKEQSITIEDGIIKFNDTSQIEQKINKLTVLLEENRKIRINNTFATANKEFLNDLKIRWIKLSNYLTDERYSNIVSYLIDGDIKVAGEDYAIIAVSYSSVLENALVNIEKIEDLFSQAMSHQYKLAFILDTEWENLKKEYIENKKKGIEYQIKQEKSMKCDIIEEDNLILNEKSAVVKEALELFGDDIIEIK